jgi:hypothetical protein
MLLERAQRRWPSQEQEQTISEYLADYERLALKYSLRRVAAALERLRIKPEQKFFPAPSDVAGEIEGIMDAERYERGRQAQFERRKKEIEEFWQRASEMMELAEIDEEELLRRFLSYRGTKPTVA